MDSLLYEIYTGDYDITPKRDKKQQELGKEICAEWEKIEKMFGGAFTDRLLDLEGEREDWQDFHYYRAGFRLGVRLMLEALTSATA